MASGTWRLRGWLSIWVSSGAGNSPLDQGPSSQSVYGAEAENLGERWSDLSALLLIILLLLLLQPHHLPWAWVPGTSIYREISGKNWYAVGLILSKIIGRRTDHARVTHQATTADPLVPGGGPCGDPALPSDTRGQ